MSADSALLEMEGVAKSFEAAFGRVDVLTRVDLSARRGEFIVITGPSGSGKSTLLHLAALLDRPTAGRMEFDGRDVAAMADDELCELRKTAIGVVFQNYHLLLNRTVQENVEFRFRYMDVDDRYVAERVDRAMRELGLFDLAAQPARLLSGGEMQRVAIARAVAAQPSILIADEPTGNLDARATRMVMECFGALHRSGITILMVTHDSTLAGYATRTAVCENGTIRGLAA